MQRITFIVITMFAHAVLYFFQLCHLSKDKYVDYDNAHKMLQEACQRVSRKGRIDLDVAGLENIPKEDGYMFYPNHQGLFDVLVFLASCPRPFAFVIKKEASKIIVLKQVIKATGSLVMDRSDIRQSIKVINQVTEEVKQGRNFLIFAEGTRSKMGNKLNPMKGGSFKAATNSKCPIVPCALIDSYRPFDEKGIKKITVKLRYLTPIYYDEYKDLKGQELAELVKSRIEEAIEKETNG